MHPRLLSCVSRPWSLLSKIWSFRNGQPLPIADERKQAGSSVCAPATRRWGGVRIHNGLWGDPWNLMILQGERKRVDILSIHGNLSLHPSAGMRVITQHNHVVITERQVGINAQIMKIPLPYLISSQGCRQYINQWLKEPSLNVCDVRAPRVSSQNLRVKVGLGTESRTRDHDNSIESRG